MASALTEVETLRELALLISALARRATVSTQNCLNLAERVELLLPFLDEVEDSENHISARAIEAFESLAYTLDKAKKLVETCCKCSKLYMMLRSDAINSQFEDISIDLDRCLDLIPLEQLLLSDETRDEIQRMKDMWKGIRFHMEGKEEELTYELQELLEERTESMRADPEIIRDLEEVLNFEFGNTWEKEIGALKRHREEARMIKDFSEERYIDDIIGLLKGAGATEMAPKGGSSSSSREREKKDMPNGEAGKESAVPIAIAIPKDFLCPMSMEMMRDPVIVLPSGVTYERAYIQYWISQGNDTCPKTGLTLKSAELTQDWPLKAMIDSWCENQGISPPPPPTLEALEKNNASWVARKVSDQVVPQISRTEAFKTARGAAHLQRDNDDMVTEECIRSGGLAHEPPKQTSEVQNERSGFALEERDRLDATSPAMENADVDIESHSMERPVEEHSDPEEEEQQHAESFSVPVGSSDSIDPSPAFWDRSHAFDHAQDHLSNSFDLVDEDRRSKSLDVGDEDDEDEDLYPDPPRYPQQMPIVEDPPHNVIMPVVEHPPQMPIVGEDEASRAMRPGELPVVVVGYAQMPIVGEDGAGRPMRPGELPVVVGYESREGKSEPLDDAAASGQLDAHVVSKETAVHSWRTTAPAGAYAQRPNTAHEEKAQACEDDEPRLWSMGEPSTVDEMKAVIAQLGKDVSDAPRRRRILAGLRRLTRVNDDARTTLAAAGGVYTIVQLLDSQDDRMMEDAVTILLNLSIKDENKGNIVTAGALPRLVHVLNVGNMPARENAAATLYSLSTLDENKVLIANAGAIPPLVTLLEEGRPAGKKDAITALYNVSIIPANKSIIVLAGAIHPLVALMRGFDPVSDKAGMPLVDKAVSLVYSLTVIAEGRNEFAAAGGIPQMINILECGSWKARENAVCALLCICVNSNHHRGLVLQEIVIPPLIVVAESKYSSGRAKEKARTLLKLFRTSRQSF